MRVCPLDQATSRARYGGKAVQLGEALRAGLPVPPGFAIEAELVEEIARGQRHAVEILATPLEQIRYPVAVRSSAAEEDSRGASFAGQHVTLLNLRDHDGVIEAIRSVYHSAHSPAALSYRARMGVASLPAIAVIVQQLVLADTAGVLFSRNPLTGAEERVIEATWGLGEAVVAGLVTPDQFRLSPAGEILERRAGEKDLMIRWCDEGGTEEVDVPASRVRTLCLDDTQLLRLHELTQRCEQVFSGQHDIEWAFVGPSLFLLQRRDVTTEAPAR